MKSENNFHYRYASDVIHDELIMTVYREKDSTRGIMDLVYLENSGAFTLRFDDQLLEAEMLLSQVRAILDTAYERLLDRATRAGSYPFKGSDKVDLPSRFEYVESSDECDIQKSMNGVNVYRKAKLLLEFQRKDTDIKVRFLAPVTDLTFEYSDFIKLLEASTAGFS